MNKKVTKTLIIISIVLMAIAIILTIVASKNLSIKDFVNIDASSSSTGLEVAGAFAGILAGGAILGFILAAIFAIALFIISIMWFIYALVVLIKGIVNRNMPTKEIVFVVITFILTSPVFIGIIKFFARFS